MKRPFLSKILYTFAKASVGSSMCSTTILAGTSLNERSLKGGLRRSRRLHIWWFCVSATKDSHNLSQQSFYCVQLLRLVFLGIAASILARFGVHNLNLTIVNFDLHKLLACGYRHIESFLILGLWYLSFSSKTCRMAFLWFPSKFLKHKNPLCRLHWYRSKCFLSNLIFSAVFSQGLLSHSWAFCHLRRLSMIFVLGAVENDDPT